MKELWTALVEVQTPPIDSGDTMAFTNIVTWATNTQEYRDRVASMFEDYGWDLIDLEDCRQVSEDINEYEGEMLEVIERVKSNPNYCICTTLHYYPSRIN